MRILLLSSTLALTLALGSLSGAGCGDDDGDNNNDNDNTITDHLSPDLAVAEGSSPDFTCFGGTDPAQTFTTDTEISGVVEDFEEEWAVENVEVSVYDSLQNLLDDVPFDTSEPTGPTGEYSVLAPAGVARMYFKMVDTTGSYFDTMELNEPIAGMPPDPPQATGHNRLIVSDVSMETVPAILGIERIEGRGIVAGRVYDCLRQEVENAAMRAYSALPEDPDRVLLSIYEGGSRNSFYFRNGMPVRDRQFTDEEGQFIIANVVATPGAFITMEMWARAEPSWLPADHPGCTEGCLISIQEIPVLPDTIVITDMLPLYSN